MNTENEFNKIYFTPAEKQILDEVQNGKNLYEVAQSLNKSISTISNQLLVIYKKTEKIIEYKSAVKRFSALQYYLTNPDLKINKEKELEAKKQRFSFDDEEEKQNNDKPQSDLEKEVHQLKEENEKLKAKIEKLSNTPPDWISAVLKIKSKPRLKNYLKNCA